MHSAPGPYPLPVPENLRPLEMKVQTNRDHMAIVVEFLVHNVLVLRLDLLKPDIAIGTVDRPMTIQEELQAAARVQTEPVLGVVKTARPFDGRIVPAPPPRIKGARRVVPSG